MVYSPSPFPRAKNGGNERFLSDKFRTMDEAARKYIQEHGHNALARGHREREHRAAGPVRDGVPHVVTRAAANNLRRQALARGFGVVTRAIGVQQRPATDGVGPREVQERYRYDVQRGQSALLEEERPLVEHAPSAIRNAAHEGDVLPTQASFCHTPESVTAECANVKIDQQLEEDTFCDAAGYDADGEQDQNDSSDDPFSDPDDYDADAMQLSDYLFESDEKLVDDPFSDVNAYEADGEQTSSQSSECSESSESSDSDDESDCSIATSRIGRVYLSPGVSELFTDSSTPPRDPARWFRAVPLGMRMPRAAGGFINARRQRRSSAERRQRAEGFVHVLQSPLEDQIGSGRPTVERRFIRGTQ